MAGNHIHGCARGEEGTEQTENSQAACAQRNHRLEGQVNTLNHQRLRRTRAYCFDMWTNKVRLTHCLEKHSDGICLNLQINLKATEKSLYETVCEEDENHL